ncbi:MAG: SLBB domain-containing protein [Pyrinomonadaceae bacterium]
MKQRKPQIHIDHKKFASWRLVQSFSIILLLSSFNLIARAQTPESAPDVKATANLVVTPPSPIISGTIKNKDSSALNTAEKIPVSIVENLIHNGDTIDVDVLGSLEYDWRGTTDDEGFLSNLPYFSVFALCQSEDNLAAEITAAYSKLIRNPQIVVRVIDRSARQPAMLFGAIKVPQRFRIERPVQLNELIVMSGGITDKASGEIKIFRPAHVSCNGHNQDQVESQVIIKLTDLLSGKPDANPLVRSGDVVTVEEAAPIYVTGGITAPQRILFRQGMTLSRAVASAGGLSRSSNEIKITIYRRQMNRSDLEIIETDYEKIMNHTAEDITLHAYDIVEIPQAGRKSNRAPIIPALESQQFEINKLPIRLID